MHSRPLSSLLAITAAASLLAVSTPTRAETSATAGGATRPQKIVVELGHFTDGLHDAIMALKLADGLQAKGAHVTLFLNLEGVRLADKRQPQNMQWGVGHEPTSAYYDRFIKRGGMVVVCPACAEAAGITAAELRPGAVVAKSEDVIDLLLAADKVISY